MTLLKYLRQFGKSSFEKLAKDAGTSSEYLGLVARRWRKTNPSINLCLNIKKASNGLIKVKDMLPHLIESLKDELL